MTRKTQWIQPGDWGCGRCGPHPPRLREQFEGVIWWFRTGGQWRETPTDFEIWQTVYDRFTQGRDTGVFVALVQGMIAEAARWDQSEMSPASMDPVDVFPSDRGGEVGTTGPSSGVEERALALTIPSTTGSHLPAHSVTSPEGVDNSGCPSNYAAEMAQATTRERRARFASFRLRLLVAVVLVAATSWGVGTVVAGSDLFPDDGGFHPPSLDSIAVSQTVDCQGLGFSVELPDGYAIVPDATVDRLESDLAYRGEGYRLSFVPTDASPILTDAVRVNVLQLRRDTTDLSDQQLRDMPGGITSEYRNSHSWEEVKASLGDRDETLWNYTVDPSVSEFRTADDHLALPVRDADSAAGPGLVLVFHGALVLRFSFARDDLVSEPEALRRFAETTRLYTPDNADTSGMPRDPDSPLAQC